MKITCIAVDDEPLALEKMENYIQKVDFLELKGSFDNGLEVMSFLRKNPVDLMFLDIQMDEITGIQLMEAITNPPKVVFTTAYDQFALKGFELDVVDYLLKPFSFPRFLTACQKVKDQIKAHEFRQQKEQTPKEPLEDFILVRSEYRLQKLRLSHILFVEGMKDYSRIYTPDIKLMTLQNLKKMEEALPSPPFLRIHKSYIISTDKIDTISKNEVTIGDRVIPIGSLYKEVFQEYVSRHKTIG